jgi:small-conductance mechanosensitive channel
MLFSGFLDDAYRWFSLSREVGGNSLERWAVALGIFVLLTAALRIAKAVVARRAGELAAKTATTWDDALVATFKATKFWFLAVMAGYVALLTLTLPDKTKSIVESVTIITMLVQAAVWGSVLLTSAIGHYVEQRRETDGDLVTTVSAVSFLAKLVLWSIVVVVALDNVGVNITALVAGLGVGGIAVALAAQNILGDLFASLSIVLDKPFVMGDFIVVGEQTGTVEKIGLKTTRLRSLSGEQLVFSNNDLLQSRIRNFKRMYERRVVFTLGVTYDTPRPMLEAIPKIIREIIEGRQSARFDRSHFKEYGDSALLFETVYFVLSPSYALYMDLQQDINLAIHARFEENHIEFAFPTRTLWIRQEKPSESS